VEVRSSQGHAVVVLVAACAVVGLLAFSPNALAMKTAWWVCCALAPLSILLALWQRRKG
jgi:protein-S-isoprenylcysteine O-methyltransferase Ste14